MRKPYLLAAPAQRDIDEMFEYIAADDIETAIRVEQELFDALLLLSSRPQMGRQRLDRKIPPHLRAWPFYSYLIIYRPDSKPLEVVRIWHTAQRVPSL